MQTQTRNNTKGGARLTINPQAKPNKETVKFNIPNRHVWQDLFYRKVRSGSHKWNVLVCGRGWGKDVALAHLILAWLLDPQDETIGWVTHRFSDAKKTLKNFKKYIAPLNGNNDFKFLNGSPLSVTYKGSTVEFLSFDRPDTIRGQNYYTRVIINEACQLKNEGWTEAVQPICNFAETVVIATTPKVGSWVRDWYDDGLQEGTDVWTLHRDCFDNPKLGSAKERAKLERQRRKMADTHYRQEYLAEWIADGDVFQNLEGIFTLTDFALPNGRVSYGVDIGIENDYTVVTGLNQYREVVYYDRFRNVHGDALIDRIMLPGEIMLGVMVIETNGIGNDIAYRIYQKAFATGKLQVIKFNTGGRTKHNLISNLIFHVNDEANRLKIPVSLTEVKEEMQTFKIYQTRLGNPEYRAAAGKHDDTVISLGLAVHGLKNIYQQST